MLSILLVFPVLFLCETLLILLAALSNGIQTIVTLVRQEELNEMKIPHMLSRFLIIFGSFF